ncbi:bifunctional tetrahydrofolate synthase/dihydrofolate synthase [Methylococcus capsulatus]|uniref:bifunctional tetrahydrofolate synthase/dihydrofolate synthase n=1 Tax=Methylococcus capsulatus TaxID=414 RepID=UPI001C527887|nr:bifunctional tetrahydrofolate synthase/dihydrofolate synthase [Methylococcus capsulatus]QXP86937.1 bifunctional tetrahydrofolate synthase/dihydrofolate synthase [Methylococcus capsulatus]QXP93383.1 bifunctional tetrahydrofolate synthase/dihydrofolate synthase [Methylococcus capsulatus]
MRFSTLGEWLSWQETLHPQAIDLGLERVRRVYRALNPAQDRPFTITVGGTNGKGSCVAALDTILRRAGYRVGAYTSPHILRYNERICIDGTPVDDAAICASFERIEAVRGDTTLSFFEFGTLAAMDIFRRAELDVQILEVGLGGRLDAVNIVDADAALVASIGIDHEEWLGLTREAIGLEKAGIFRPSRPCILGDPDAPATVLRHAEAIGADLLMQGRDFSFRRENDGWTWYGRGETHAALPEPCLRGDHQYFNMAAVLQVIEAIRPRLPVPEAAVRAGLASVHLPGRFQIQEGEPTVLLDVAHNPHAVRVLAEFLRQFKRGRPVHAVFAMMRDKDIRGVVECIRDLVDDWYLAPLQLPRAATPEILLPVFSALGISQVQQGFADAAEVFARVRRNAENDSIILVFGSFFLVAEYLARIEPIPPKFEETYG